MQYLWLLQQINWWYFTINHICTNDDNKDTILPLTFWSTKRSCTSDKIHLQQTKFKYCGANVNITGWETVILNPKALIMVCLHLFTLWQTQTHYHAPTQIMTFPTEKEREVAKRRNRISATTVTRLCPWELFSVIRLIVSTKRKIRVAMVTLKRWDTNMKKSIHRQVALVSTTHFHTHDYNKCQSLFMLVNSLTTAAHRSITPMNMTSWLEEQEQLLLMSPIQMYDEDESFTGDIRDCSINKLNMILNTSVTDLKMHITSANRMTDASIQTRDTEYADMGVQVCS